MASITASGVGSGLDIESIVTSLMKAERLPIDKLTTQKTGVQAQITSYGKLSSALDAFRGVSRELSDLSAFRIFSTSSANEGIATATAGSSATPGSFGVEVVQLADYHKQGSTELASTAQVGTAGDQMTLGVGSNAFTLDIGGKTLTEIRDAVNGADDNAGVKAQIITGDGGNQKLVLTSKDSGTANTVAVSFADSGGAPISDPLGLTQITAPKDAVVKIDGYQLTRSSNSIDDAVEGVTLNLKTKSTPGEATQINVAADPGAAVTAVKSFVDSYNNVLETMNTLRFKEGLFGDPLIRQVEDKLRGVLNSPAGGLSLSYLSQAGVSLKIKDVEVMPGVVTKQSYLSLDSSTLTKAMSKDFDGVRGLFADSSQGFAKRMAGSLDSMLKSNGLVDARRKGLSSTVDRIDKRSSVLENRMTVIEARLRKQFGSLDILVGNMKTTGESLSSQLSNLPFTSKN